MNVGVSNINFFYYEFYCEEAFLFTGSLTGWIVKNCAPPFFTLYRDRSTHHFQQILSNSETSFVLPDNLKCRINSTLSPLLTKCF